MSEGKVEKVCSRCKETKPLEEFHIDRSRKDHHCYWCKSCIKKYQKSIPHKRKEWSRNYYETNKELVLGRQKRLRLENPEEYKTKHKKSYEKNKDKVLKKQKEYRETLPNHNIKNKIYSFFYGRTRNPTGGYFKGDGCCLYCGEINPFTLENHHPFGKKTHPDFTITLCANHHSQLHRMMASLEDWK